MNREDIIRMAREAKFERLGHTDNDWVCYPEDIERFAALVASAEHKRVQQVYTDAATDSVKAAIAYEREACAKVCENLNAWNMDDPGSSASEAIRARGQP